MSTSTKVWFDLVFVSKNLGKIHTTEVLIYYYSILIRDSTAKVFIKLFIRKVLACFVEKECVSKDFLAKSLQSSPCSQLLYL